MRVLALPLHSELSSHRNAHLGWVARELQANTRSQREDSIHARSRHYWAITLFAYNRVGAVVKRWALDSVTRQADRGATVTRFALVATPWEHNGGIPIHKAECSHQIP